VGHGGVDEAEVLLGCLASGKLLPGLGALADNVHGVLLVLALAGEGKLVLGLAIGDLVDAEPLVGGAEEAGQVALNVLDVVELGGQRVVHVDNHDLPVGLTLVEQGHDTEHLDLDDLSGLVDKLADLADVERVVVALGLGLLVGDIGVLPRLQLVSAFALLADIGLAPSHLREGTVVPEVALVGEAVPHVAELALLDVLLDGVERLLLGDLSRSVSKANISRGRSLGRQLGDTHLHLGIGPAGHLNNHVEDGLLLVGIERNVVPWRDELPVLLNEDTVLERVGRADSAGGVGHFGQWFSGCWGCRGCGELLLYLFDSAGGAGTRGFSGRRHCDQRHHRLSA
jgi:hypothetical protein